VLVFLGNALDSVDDPLESVVFLEPLRPMSLRRTILPLTPIAALLAATSAHAVDGVL